MEWSGIKRNGMEWNGMDSLAQSIAYRAKESAMQRVGEQYTNKLAEQLSDLQNVYSAAGSTNLGEIDAQKLVELTAKYYDAGVKWNSARNQIWQDLYGPKGVSRNLIDNKIFIARMDEAQRAVNNYIAYYYNQQQALQNINKKYDTIIGGYKPTQEQEGFSPQICHLLQWGEQAFVLISHHAEGNDTRRMPCSPGEGWQGRPGRHSYSNIQPKS